MTLRERLAALAKSAPLWLSPLLAGVNPIAAAVILAAVQAGLAELDEKQTSALEAFVAALPTDATIDAERAAVRGEGDPALAIEDDAD